MVSQEPDLDDVPNRVSVRTDPDAGYATRYKTLHDAQHALDETSKTKAILAACRHVDADRRGKRRAIEYLADRLPPKELAEVCRRLSTSELQLDVGFDSAEEMLEVRVGEK
ncbi:hypothetical protein B4589_009545 [Halolamina sp. CBA1230]|uniref:hypothetical protein n=1 Tax=Halolamina sp. CBA1230 TaxID=1853690 RepID=UPI00159345A7|nr:hypothetical protein [Halolamina sp. CBA1230]QKY20609.1 hypothetical protein B4589_009545 [Halolamina sp. CBA1230]